MRNFDLKMTTFFRDKHFKTKMLIFVQIAITPFSIIKIQNVGGVLENSGNLQQDGHKNFEN